ncbi:MAG: Eco57I restriction-modification methylase domain-containing protein [Microcoleus sp.]
MPPCLPPHQPSNQRFRPLGGHGGTAPTKNETALPQERGENKERIEVPLIKGDLGGSLDAKLRHLLSYTDEPHQFTNSEVDRLIKALDNCKILDPACGSGAFPMGILQKMVHILAKLDPHNERWRNQQREREILPLLKDLQQAQKISYEQAREAAVSQLQERLAQIEADFANNEKDYPRKLFLIENCIYGVDIQPIALQIAKLRCFISLIVEQKVDNNQPNRGILPLPNLETKFVAANSLIRFNDQMSLRSPAVQEREKELKEVRQKHFTARSKATKDKYRQRDQELRGAIGDLLKGTGLEVALADSLARWNPYNQNTSADFFDPEWMFGIGDGFDIVIGNPPYIRIQELDKKLSTNFKNSYNTAFKNYDIYVLFIERAVEDLIKSSGNVCFINPTKFIKSDYGTKLKELIYKKSLLELFIDLTDVEVFDSAITYTGIFLFSKGKKNIFNYVKLEANQASYLKKLSELKLDQVSYDKISEKTWLLGSNELQKVFGKIKCFSILSKFSELFVGLQTSADPVYILEIQGDKLYSKHTNKLYKFNYDIVKPLLKGAEIKRYSTPELKYKIIFPYQTNNSSVSLLSEKELKSKYPLIWEYFVECQEKLKGRENGKMDISGWWAFGRNQNLGCFVQPKIMTQVLANHSSLTLDLNGEYYFVGGGTAGGYGITLKENSQLSYQYLLGLLNSTLIEKYLQSYSTPFKGGFFAYNRDTMGKIPIPTATEAERKAIETLVGYVLHLTAALKDIPSSGKEFMASADDQLMLSYFEQIIDAAVMELYLPEELHAGDKYFMRHLLQENLPNIDKIKGDKIAELRVIFRRLFDRDHPIRTNIYFLSNLDIVKIIRGEA